MNDGGGNASFLGVSLPRFATVSITSTRPLGGVTSPMLNISMSIPKYPSASGNKFPVFVDILHRWRISPVSFSVAFRISGRPGESVEAIPSNPAVDQDAHLLPATGAVASWVSFRGPVLSINARPRLGRTICAASLAYISIFWILM